MKIIRESQVKYEDTTFIGKCFRCGLVFEVTFPVAHMLDGSVMFNNTEWLDELEYKKDRFTCNCPECKGTNVLLAFPKS